MSDKRTGKKAKSAHAAVNSKPEVGAIVVPELAPTPRMKKQKK